MPGPGLFTNPSAAGYARVAVERGVDRFPEGLTYAVPAELSDVEAGEAVVVPLGRGDRATTGYVVERLVEIDLDPAKTKTLVSRDRSLVRLPPGLVDLARWVSAYYAAPLGTTFASMVPSAVKRTVGRVQRAFLDLGRCAGDEDRLSAAQKRLLEVIRERPAEARPIELRELLDLAGVRTAGPVERLVASGLLVRSRRTGIEASWGRMMSDARAPAQLTPAQAQVIGAVGAALEQGFSSHLLFGVTGSGKTEVFIRLIEKVLAAGKCALVLVPEIALTPQTAGRLLGRFPESRVAILHSALSSAQRHQQWALAAAGEADVVIGARSAVFAPIPDGRLGLIVVDEEHDSSYKQDQMPRYHGRDVALRRGQLAQCPVLLASATPSLESWHNATGRGVHTLHQMPHRVPGMRLPRVRIVDFAVERRERRDRRVHLLGPTLERTLARSLETGGQAILLLNRRGYSSYIACPDSGCGWVMSCHLCDVTMVYHVARHLPTGGFVRCHHCQTEQKLPAACPVCQKRLILFGLGTQRVEEELESKFPLLRSGITLERVDSDTMRSAAHFHELLERFGSGEIRVLVGTQMIAKGLDFPGVRVVGVINADTAIHLPDFRASERTFQLVSQVAGRCGRATDVSSAGEVVVQSFHPEVPAITLAAAHDYEGFARAELASRQSCGLPPATRLARLVIRHAQERLANENADRIAGGLRRLMPEGVSIRGPISCPLARIDGRFRMQIELLARSPGPIQELLARARSTEIARPSADLIIDVDPVALL